MGFTDGATRASLKEYLRVSKQAFSNTLEQLWRTSDGTKLPILARPGFFSSYNLMSLEESLAQKASMERFQGNYQDWVEPTPRAPRIRPGWYHKAWVPFASSLGSLWLMEDHTRIRPGWYHKAWVPFASSLGSLWLMEEHAPQPEGIAGQVIGYIHDPDEIVWIANSLSELLPLSAAQLESAPEEYGIVW